MEIYYKFSILDSSSVESLLRLEIQNECVKLGIVHSREKFTPISSLEDTKRMCKTGNCTLQREIYPNQLT